MRLEIFFTLLSPTLSLTQLWAIGPAPTLAPFGHGTKAICRSALGEMSVSDAKAIHSSYYPRIALPDLKPRIVDPSSTPAITAAFAKPGKSVPADKIPYLHNFLWTESRSVIRPNLRTLGSPDLNNWAERGIDIKTYSGDMLFDSPTAAAKFSVVVKDSRSLVNPSDLPDLRNLASKGDISLLIEDKKGALSLAEVHQWASGIIKHSKLNIADESGNNITNVHDKAYFEVTENKSGRGNKQYSIKLKNLFMDHSSVTWFIENVQKSLAPDEFSSQSAYRFPSASMPRVDLNSDAFWNSLESFSQTEEATNRSENRRTRNVPYNRRENRRRTSADDWED